MDIYFRTTKLAKIFSDEKKLLRKYGAEQTKKIRRRMMELRISQSLYDLAPPYTKPSRCHELVGERKGQLSVDLKHPYRLLFIPQHEPIPQKQSGGLDWGHVTAITILGVEDTHG